MDNLAAAKELKFSRLQILSAPALQFAIIWRFNMARYVRIWA